MEKYNPLQFQTLSQILKYTHLSKWGGSILIEASSNRRVSTETTSRPTIGRIFLTRGAHGEDAFKIQTVHCKHANIQTHIFQTTRGKSVCCLKPSIVWYDDPPQERGRAQEQWKPEHKRKVNSPQNWLSAHCHYVENMKWNRGKLSKVVFLMVLCNVYVSIYM